jgi:hypothetical protein
MTFPEFLKPPMSGILIPLPKFQHGKKQKAKVVEIGQIKQLILETHARDISKLKSLKVKQKIIYVVFLKSKKQRKNKTVYFAYIVDENLSITT